MNDATGLLLGPVFGGLLRLRGITSLHGCVVAVGGGAVAILAERGTGKSTLAAAMAQRGHPVLSDDIAAISAADGGWIALPGYPRLRVHPGTPGALPAPDAGPVWTDFEKRYVELSISEAATSYRFQRDPLRLEAVYELRRDSEADEPRIEAVRGADTVTTLVRHTRNVLAPLPAAARREEFARLGRLAAAVAVRRLVVPDDLGSLPAVCRTLAG